MIEQIVTHGCYLLIIFIIITTNLRIEILYKPKKVKQLIKLIDEDENVSELIKTKSLQIKNKYFSKN